MGLPEFMKQDFSCIPREEIRRFIDAVETMVQTSGESLEVPHSDLFSEAVYARTVKLPAESLVVGKIHKYRNLNVLLKGEVSVLSQDGVIRVKAPYTVVSSPGVKRVVYAHEDSEWMTIHGTTETDVDKIEEHFIAKSYDEVK